MTPELASQIALWRARAAANTLTPEEMRQIVIQLREGRVAAAATSATAKKAKAKAEIPNGDDLFKELMGDI